MPAAGLAALLTHPTALRDQLRAILEAGRAARLAVLIPMVSSLGEVDLVRAALAETAAALAVPPPRLGIMVELAATAAAAETFAPAVDFFSIGTNDLAGQVLGLDRRDPPRGRRSPRTRGCSGSSGTSPGPPARPASASRYAAMPPPTPRCCRCSWASV